MKIEKTHLGHYAIAGSVALLAASIFYFSEKLSSLENAADSLAMYRDLAPELVAEVEKISEQIPAIVNEVALTRQQLQQQVPEVLAEVAAVREVVPVVVEQIPPIIEEVSALRQDTVPALLTETAALRQDTIPALLAETEMLRKETIPAVLSESQALRQETIPNVVAEVKVTREQMPMLLSQANEVARTAGQNASEGAVSGFFSGLIKAPISLVAGFGGSAFSGTALTDRDKQLLADAGQRVLDKNYQNASESWENSESGRHGKVELIKMVVDGDERCRQLDFSGYSGRRSLNGSRVNICHDEKGIWKIKE